MGFMSTAVYTILQSEKLHKAYRAGRRIEFSEGKAWQRASELLGEARERDLILPIVFAPGERTRDLIYYGHIDDLTVLSEPDSEGNRTHVVVTNLVRIKPPRPRKMDLTVVSTNRGIPSGYIRPYVICKTPKFLK